MKYFSIIVLIVASTCLYGQDSKMYKDTVNCFSISIPTGITKKITDFLEKNRASVFATISGHAGVGKRASIQRMVGGIKFFDGAPCINTAIQPWKG